MRLQLAHLYRLTAFLALLAMLLAAESSASKTSPRTHGAPLRSQPRSAYNPVVFLPGDGGSQMEARLNKSERVHYWCELQSDWFDIWLNAHLLAPGFFDCLSDNLRLTYNRSSHLTSNTPGVDIRPTSFGSLASVDYLDLYHFYLTDYFHQISSTLAKVNGLQADLDMVGAPFDFRKAPNELADHFANLTSLIERTFTNNGYRPVTLICHSMGCLNAFHLLNSKPQNWRDVFIRRLVSLAAPWDGSFKAISAMLFGDNLGIPLLNSAKLQALQSTFPSLMYLFPHEPSFESRRTLIETPAKNYSLANLADFLDSLNMTDQRMMWQDTRRIALKLRPPNVELWCLYGLGVDTPNRLTYLEQPPGGKWIEQLGDGDGTVNADSLAACKRFAGQQDKPVYTHSFNKTDHIAILRDGQAASFIATEILAGDLEAGGSRMLGRLMESLQRLGRTTEAGGSLWGDKLLPRPDGSA